MDHGAGNGRTQTYVDLRHTASLDDGGRIAVPDSAAGHNGDPSARGFYQRGNRIGAFKAGLFAAGSEKPVSAGGTDIFEGAEKICGHVEGSMECHG